MYVLVDLVFVIKRNWELRAPAIPHGFLGLAISISITVLETTDLVHADLILFTSLFYLRGRRNPHLNPLPDPFSRFPPNRIAKSLRMGCGWGYVDFPQTNARLNTRKMASATKPVQVFRNFLIGVSKTYDYSAQPRHKIEIVLTLYFVCLFVFFLQKKLKVPLRYPNDQVARYVIITQLQHGLYYIEQLHQYGGFRKPLQAFTRFPYCLLFFIKSGRHMQHNLTINLTINKIQFINLHTTKHFLNLVVTKDVFFILYCDFVFLKSSGIEFHKFVPLHCIE